ncbi:MAG: PEP-CTERM sorting domain-containing protein [Planctomycetota bacterium]
MDRMLQLGVFAAAAGMASTAAADLVKVADSIEDFSAVQTQNNWTYGWYHGDDVGLSGATGSLQTSNFQELEFHDAEQGWWTHDSVSASQGQEGSPYFLTVITSEFMHANAPIPGGLIAEESRWASRRWTSSVGGEVQVTGQIAKVDQGTPLGDGIDAYVLVDGEIAFYYDVAPDDHAGTTFDLTLDVSEGSVIEFVVGGRESGLNDAVLFTSEIMGDVVPAPGSVALIGMGGMLIGRRRR